QKPVDIVNAALKEAKLKFYDVLLVDTAGRLHVDEAMMDEIKQTGERLLRLQVPGFQAETTVLTGAGGSNSCQTFNPAADKRLCI
ncbi:hypothetical protein MJN47_28405, partial [Salmonella enterica subsp. enterica serovar Lubbock]|nr:hypothetical protein [Salmonella enterica subsp. enterica serovar Lubbock]